MFRGEQYLQTKIVITFSVELVSDERSKPDGNNRFALTRQHSQNNKDNTNRRTPGWYVEETAEHILCLK